MAFSWCNLGEKRPAMYIARLIDRDATGKHRLQGITNSQSDFLISARVPANLIYQQRGDRSGKKEVKDLSTCYRIDLNKPHIPPLQGLP